MNRYADPTVCPGCRSDISYGASACPHCSLRLTGSAAQLLYTTLVRADQLVDELRRPEPLPVRPMAAGPMVARSGAGHVPASASPAPRVGANSVPKVLLGLGALCLLVAALVFLAVAWSTLGVGGRTAVLVGLTATSAVGCALLAARNLRAGAEAFAAIALGLLTLDVVGADSSGWWGDLSSGELAMLVGGVLGTSAWVAAYAGLHSPVRRLIVAELLSPLGLLLIVVGAGSTQSVTVSAACVLGVILAALLGLVAWRVGLSFVTGGSAAVAGLCWLMLVLDGLAIGLEHPTVAALWGDLRIWPLLAAALLATLPALVLRLPRGLRIAAAGLALTLATVIAGLPAVGDPLTTRAVVALTLLAAAVTIARLAPSPWGWSALGALLLPGMTIATVVLLLCGEAADRLIAPTWSVSLNDRLDGTTPSASPLVVLPGVLLLIASAWVLLRLGGVTIETRAWAAPVVGLGTTAMAVTLTLQGDLRAVVVAVLLGGAALTWLAARGRSVGLVCTALVALVVLVAALPSDWLTGSSLLVLTALALVSSVLAVAAPTRLVASATGTVLAGGLLWTVGDLFGLETAWLPVLVIAGLGALILVRPQPATELAAAPTALLAVLAADLSAPSDLTWWAAYLTLAGALVTASGIYHRRQELGWTGAALLLLATWARLADLDVRTVEAYTLPLAVALTGFGLYRMWRDEADSLVALTPGLALAVVPSLLQVLVEPVSMRAALLGAVCTALVLGGAGLRWSAPLLVGASAGLVLVLREATYAQVLPQWVLLGLAGILLTGIGVTWERRLQELRLAMGYLRGLR